MSRGFDIPEAGNREALEAALTDLGITVAGDSHQGYNPDEIRFVCPYCEYVGWTGNPTASMNVETTQWLCYMASCGDGRDEFGRRGNLLSLRSRAERIARKPRGRHSHGDRSSIAEQVQRTLTLLAEGCRTSAIVRQLMTEYGVTRRTAFNRLDAARGGRQGRRRDSAAALARMMGSGVSP